MMKILVFLFLIGVPLVEGQTTTTAITTTANAFNFKCAGVSCPAGSLTFYTEGTTLLCWSADDMVTSCNGTAFVPYPEQTVPPETPCHGTIAFTIGEAQYWLNGTTFYQLSEITNNWGIYNGSSVTWFLGRLRPNEATGWVYCWANASDYQTASSAFYFYNGTYYDVGINNTGQIVKMPQTVSRYSLTYAFIDNDDNGCSQPVCCWIQSGSINEVIYTGSFWYTWEGSSYALYSGEFTEQINLCAEYFDDANFTDPRYLKREVAYVVQAGSVYQVTKNGPLQAITANISTILNYYQYDPEATGSFYTFDSTKGIGIYQNLTYLSWWVNIVNGTFNYQPIPPYCSDVAEADDIVGISGNPYPFCNATLDIYVPSLYQVCDPTSTINECGAEQKCTPMPSILAWPSLCIRGLCLTDYQQVCSPKTNTTVAPQRNVTAVTTTESAETTASATTMAPLNTIHLKRYGASCSLGTDCFTGICSSGVCTCNNCTQVLPAIEYDIQFGIVYYTEKCIPLSATVAGKLEACDMWAEIPSRYCGTGMICTACPETWSSPYFQATCIPFADYLEANTTCSGYTCGYAATCVLVGGFTPTCVCPAGYNLESNLQDCYGWKASYTSDCSVTCGNGVQTVQQVCDKAPGSLAKCDGNGTEIILPCVTPECSVNSTMLAAAVVIAFPSKVMTTALFDSLARDPIRAAVATALNDACVLSQDTFENQCCPGRVFEANRTALDCITNPDGITITNEYSNGGMFSFLMFARGNPSSVCCARPAITFSRKRRSTFTNNFDQSALASYVKSAYVLSAMNTAIQAIDPSVTIDVSSIESLTTTTASTEAVTSTVRPRLTGIAGMSNTVITMIAGVLAAGFGIIIVGCTIWYYVRKRNAKLERLREINYRSSASKLPPEFLRKQEPVIRANVRRQMSGLMTGDYGGYVEGTEHGPVQYTEEDMTDGMMRQGSGSYPPYYAAYRPDAMRAAVVSPRAAHGF